MSTTNQAERRKRVNLLKKLIMVFIFAIILVPILLCVILSTRLHNMEQDMKDIRQKLDHLTHISHMSMVQPDSQVEVDESESEWKLEHVQDTSQTPETGVDASDEPGMGDETVDGPLNQQTGEQPGMDSSVQNTEEDASAEVISQEEQIRKVYLTFDDGPNSTTSEILDILATYDVKATFFVNGREDKESQDMLKRIVEEGHTLGMHSYSHVYDDIYGSVEGFASDLGKLQGYLYDVTGVTSKVYRFPGGSSNKVSSMDMRVFIGWLEEQGIEYYDWNISSGDANPVRLTAEQVLENCTKDLSRYRNAIILLHDAPSKQTTVEALPALIEKILEMEDTVILPITEDTKPVHHITNKEETEDE